MRVKKSRLIVAAADVPIVFDDACIAKLAKVAKLPAHADLASFGRGIREAACIFARDARGPNANALHDEIAELYRAADGRLYEELATLMEQLSPRASVVLANRGGRLGLPLSAPDAIRDPERREDACTAIVTLCSMGGKEVKGRRRPGGKQSRPAWCPLLYAPARQRIFAKRDAERNFVMWLRSACLDATGEVPAQTARHGDPSRDLGPFARLVRDCLRLVGAPDADPVGLINELDRRRSAMQSRSAKNEAPGIDQILTDMALR
jgi:hypothetical protein